MAENKQFPIAPALVACLPDGGKYASSVLHFDVHAERYFERIDIKSIYLRDLILRTLWKIIHSGFQSSCAFGSLIEGQTIAGGVAEVTGDHRIRIDSRRLKQYEETVAMAILAHELAHDHLGHFKIWKNNLEFEHAADNLAKNWGFHVDSFRKTCGPPGVNARILQIAVIS